MMKVLFASALAGVLGIAGCAQCDVCEAYEETYNTCEGWDAPSPECENWVSACTEEEASLWVEWLNCLAETCQESCDRVYSLGPCGISDPDTCHHIIDGKNGRSECTPFGPYGA